MVPLDSPALGPCTAPPRTTARSKELIHIRSKGDCARIWSGGSIRYTVILPFRKSAGSKLLVLVLSATASVSRNRRNRFVVVSVEPSSLSLKLVSWLTRISVSVSGFSVMMPSSVGRPTSFAALYRRVGLEPFNIGFGPGFADIIRYKVLKTLRISSRNAVERIVPWTLASRLVDRRHRVTAQPLARRP